ncbi:MAG: ferrochelatase [Alphaproteobacteria bacterium]|nr:ferrochelatase [Alphaproteobacteria bacterium]
MKKKAVVLFNLGGPDSKAAIRPFLMNFFMDPNIIRLPIPLRCIVAWLIARKRSKREANDSYGELGGRSPLLENSQAQARALEAALGENYKVFVCMRYWHPMSAQVVREVRDWGADEIVLLPLYPQFSTTTTWSSLGVWNKAMAEAGFARPTSMICCYPFNAGFVQASAENIAQQVHAAQAQGHRDIRVLFSAHGLPQSVIKDGDPYQWQCEETAKRIADKLQISDWSICYQSRVGPQKWIGPSTEEEIERAASEGKAVIIYPHAFTQEHVETLVELDIEYRHKAEALGIKGYYVARTVGTHPVFIDGLKHMVLAHQGRGDIAAEGGASLCPTDFRRCCMRSALVSSSSVGAGLKDQTPTPMTRAA